MAATPSLPPYAHVTQEAVQCAAAASLRYEVPELLLHAVMVKENGRMGKCVKNKDGSYDCGLAQINTSWVEHFARYGVKLEHLLHDTCTNLQASAYILKKNYLRKNNDWFAAIVSYNIGPNNWTPERYRIGYKYATDVVKNWWAFQNWVDAKNGVTRRVAQAASGATTHAPQAPQSSQPSQYVFSPDSAAETKNSLD